MEGELCPAQKFALTNCMFRAHWQMADSQILQLASKHQSIWLLNRQTLTSGAADDYNKLKRE